MNWVLIPDAGPLFSLAAGNLLDLLSHFRVGITDVVYEESIARGQLEHASIEAQRLLSYYMQNTDSIIIFATQMGHLLAARKRIHPNRRPLRNMGELSIQSLLIELQHRRAGVFPVVLFEDSWFLRHVVKLPRSSILLSTQAFLEYAEDKGWLASADEARQAIAGSRPSAYRASKIVPNDIE